MDYYQSKRLREERKAVVDQIHEISRIVKEESRPLTPEETEKFDKLEVAQKDLLAQIESAERVERAETMTAQSVDSPKHIERKSPIVTSRDRNLAFAAWALHQTGHDSNITSEMGEAVERTRTPINCNQYSVPLLDKAPTGTIEDIKRDYTNQITPVSTDAAIQNVDLIAGLEVNIKTFGQLRNAARVIRTPNYNPLPFIYEDDTAVSAEEHTKVAAIDSTAISPQRAVLYGYPLTTGVYPVALETMLASGINLTDMVSEAMGVRYARKANDWYTNGGGTTEPTGILTAVNATNIYAYQATTDWYSVLVACLHGVDVAYRNRPSSAFVFADSLLEEFHLLRDALGRPLWNVSLAVGNPDTLLGKPFYIDNAFGTPDNQTGVTSVMFGDWSKFVIRDCGDLKVTVLNESFAELAAVGFVLFGMTDSACLNPNAFSGAVPGSGSQATCGTPLVGLD